jgi:ribosomal protein S18 acetylase RimI-like enzyme
VESVEERAHRNLCDWTRWTGRLDPKTTTIDDSGIVAVAGSTDFPTSRVAIRSDESLAPEAWASRVDDFLTDAGKTACVYTRVGTDDDLTAQVLERGFVELTTTPEMACDNPVGSRAAPAGVTVRFANSPADISAYARIAAEAFAHLMLPQAITLDAIDHPDQYLADDCVVSLAEIDGIPVAGAQLVLFADRRAYVAWVACADAARGRGLGDTVTRAITNEAFRRGADLVTLEASSFGEHTYARMGYREVYRYRMLIRVRRD